jgi:hypothetical protein
MIISLIGLEVNNRNLKVKAKVKVTALIKVNKK